MNIIFMGTPEIAEKTLRKIDETYGVSNIFTQPDKPNMRGNKIKYSPVKEYALSKGIPCHQPLSVRKEETLNLIRDMNPDLIVVVAYGKILPRELIDIPKYGVINLHASILPKYRGAAPIHYAVINGDKSTGVSVMYINEKLDEGDVILQKEIPILREDILQDVYDRLVTAGSEALTEAIKLIFEGKAIRVPQDHSKATFTKPIEKEECRIDWNKSAEEIYNFVRGLNPFPVAFSEINGKRLKIYGVEVIDNNYPGKNGEVAAIIKDRGPVIKTGDKSVVLLAAKPENKNMQKGTDLINGNIITINDILE